MLFELLSAHPHLLEGPEGAQDRAADPGAEATVRTRVGATAATAATDYLDLHVLRGNVRDLSLQTLKETLEEGVAAGDNHVGEKVTADVNVGSAYRFDYHVMQACKATSRQFIILNNGFEIVKSLLFGTFSQ